jgi:cytoskeletal protein CcmA (bactofilin family)
MKIKFNILLLVFLALFGALQTEAITIRTSADINLKNETFSENFYAAGGNLNLDSVFEKDAFLIGMNINLNSLINGDALILGGEINVSNDILGDLRIMGGRVNINGKIEGDLVIFGGRVYLNEKSQIKGQTILISGELIQNSPIENNSHIIAGSVLLNSVLSGNAEITTQNITFGEKSKIIGSLQYFSPQKAFQRDGSEVTGKVNFNQINTIRETGVVKTAILNLISFWIILRFITTVIFAFILIQMFKVFTQGVNDIALNSFVKSFFVGILSLFAIPFITVILFISLIALPIGFLLIMFYVFIVIISSAISGIVVGNLVADMVGKKQSTEYVNFHNAVIGIVLLTVLRFVPYLGDITIILFTFVSIGAILRYYNKNIIKK